MAKKAETKHRLRMEIKEISAAGEFEGKLSVYGNVDDGKDLVEPGAFTKTIQERGGEVPLLWQHDPETPIGMLSLSDGPDALQVKGKLLMELPEAQKAYALIKARIVKGLSIGFETIKKEMKDGVRRLKELRLFEGSIVTFPMNELATITNVKQNSDGPDDFYEELTEIQVRSLGSQIMAALDNALCQVKWSDLSDDEIITATGTIFDQCKEAYLAYLPPYLSAMNEMANGNGYMGRRAMEIKASGGKTKRVAGVDLPPGSFAYVGDPEKTETWKLPIDFPGDDAKTKSHIRNALARFSSTLGIPDSEKAKVLAKIHAAAKRHGIDVSDKSIALYEFEALALDAKAISARLVELKAGRTHSAATMAHYDAMAEHVKGMQDHLDALQEEAGESTSDPEAADKSKPDELHLAAQTLKEIRSLIPAA